LVTSRFFLARTCLHRWRPVSSEAPR
jgi:hypothetical protein